MFKKRNITTLTITLFFTHFLYGQIDSLFYDFKITIKGLKSAKAYLGYYYADETFVIDSTKVDTLTGFMRFSRRRRVPEGMYFIANSIQMNTDVQRTTNDGVIMDFVVNGWKDFSIKTNLNSPIDSAEIIRSDENSAYFEYLQSFNKLRTDILELEDRTCQVNSITNDDLKLYYRKLKMLDNLAPNFIKKYPQTLWAKILLVKQPPSVLAPSNATFSVFGVPYKTEMSDNTFLFNKKYYWDNFDFRDIRLLRTRVYVSKLKLYVDEMTQATTDSIKQYCDILLAYTKVNLEYYQTTLKWLTQHYEAQLNDPKAQTVFEHLVKNYHHRTSSGTSAVVLESLDRKLASLKQKKFSNTPSVNDD